MVTAEADYTTERIMGDHIGISSLSFSYKGKHGGERPETLPKFHLGHQICNLLTSVFLDPEKWQVWKSSQFMFLGKRRIWMPNDEKPLPM